MTTTATTGPMTAIPAATEVTATAMAASTAPMTDARTAVVRTKAVAVVTAVPRAEGHPDYSDPVPQPPGSQGDDSITPDGGEPTPPAPDEVDDQATQALESDEASAGFPWPIVALVGVGAAAIGFVLFMARRTRP